MFLDKHSQSDAISFIFQSLNDNIISSEAGCTEFKESVLVGLSYSNMLYVSYSQCLLCYHIQMYFTSWLKVIMTSVHIIK